MKVDVEYFGRLEPLFGTHRDQLTLPPETPVSELLNVLASRAAEFALMADVTAVAINDVVVSRDHVLADSDRVSLLPPVSGGQTTPAPDRLTNQPIDLDALLRHTESTRAGALCVFAGTVRDMHEGQAVEAITYSAQEAIATQTIRAIEAELIERHDIESCLIVHRLGRLELSEVSVAIVVRAEHRAPAFDACREAIERIKQSLPVWKHEHFPDGRSEWQPGVPLSIESGATDRADLSGQREAPE